MTTILPRSLKWTSPRISIPVANLGEIPGKIAPRFIASVNLLLGENLGEIRGRIPARFWPPGLLLPARILVRFVAGSR